MKVSYETSGFDNRIVLLNLEGDLNIENCREITNVFQEIIDTEKYYIIALMEKVTFMASPFLGKLMGCKLRVKEKGGNMVMVGLGYQLREKLTMMGANKVFQFFSDMQTAYNYYRWDFDEKAQVMKLRMPPNLRAVPAVRRLISGIARQKGYDQKESFRIETIVDEVSNNAIEHGDKDQSNIELELHIDKKKVEFEVKNKTVMKEVSNLESLVNSEINTDPGQDFRGRGLALVKLISNSIDLNYDKGTTSVKITKLREDQDK
jgi:anti-anti-sigma factor